MLRFSLWSKVLFLVVACAMSSHLTQAQSTQTHYYWVAPLLSSPVNNPQSFVIAVDDSTAAQIEAILTSGGQPGFGGKIEAGSVDYNKDYYSPDHHVWNWHVAAVLKIFDFRDAVFIQCQCPYLIGNPSDIAADPNAWIQKNGDLYVPKNYQIIHQIQPAQKDAVANISNRGLTGAGEKTLISGFIVTGGEPRNVVVRALGPSLSSSGIKQFVTNPRVDLYQGSKVIGGNKDWKKDLRADELAQKYPSLAPSNDNEAAMLLTLLPGTYSLEGISEDGTEGVMILEAYDVDSSNP